MQERPTHDSRTHGGRTSGGDADGDAPQDAHGDAAHGSATPPPSPAGRAAPPPSPDSRTVAARWLWTALALTAAAFAVAGLVAAGWRPLLETDADVARWFHGRALAHPAWTETCRVFSDWVWDPVTMRILVGVAALWVWLRGEALLALWCVATAAAGTGVQQGLKSLLDRDRPHWEHPVDSAHYSAMPSGHAMTAAVAFVLVVWLVRRSGAGRGPVYAAYAAAVVSVAGVCLTRIALGVHWLTDTVVGTLLGVALAAAAAGWWTVLAHRRAEGEPA
ncbi:phosphatase PAP2 family protein [Streptomyces nanshensis]|uniref:phosphatase PAP2 family protein n=1 Tax=Streptomyces nanshensis TaxID=518642 RepID=UPI00099FA329|nr:phosphatase PAP2 family protein [Streptomyces nanshensis]